MELIFDVVYWSAVPIASIAFVLLIFLVSDKVWYVLRALLASGIATTIYVVPTLVYNAIEGLNSDVNPVIYTGLFFVPSLFVSLLVSWAFARKVAPKPERTFE